ncbi:MAG: tetratricopeptide repeat protein [Acidobacteriota bacterium]|nr:tetratricopeptide repeat protein [Acidobacteriota bacterium]
MSRLSRKEMKRDEVLEGAARFVHLVREHGRKLVVGLGVVVVLALAGAFWLSMGQRKQTRANEALSYALQVYRAEIDVLAPRPDDPTTPTFASEQAREAAAKTAFEAVRREFGGSKVASVAAGYLADLATKAGDQETARELWEGAAPKAETALEVELWVNRLALDRTGGKSEGVLAELQAMLGDGGSTVPVVVVLDQMAETLLVLDRRGEAREIYQRILDDHPGTAYALRAGTVIPTL